MHGGLLAIHILTVGKEQCQAIVNDWTAALNAASLSAAAELRIHKVR